jgi:hypothetical protein
VIIVLPLEKVAPSTTGAKLIVTRPLALVSLPVNTWGSDAEAAIELIEKSAAIASAATAPAKIPV